MRVNGSLSRGEVLGLSFGLSFVRALRGRARPLVRPYRTHTTPGPEPGKSGVVQILAPNLASGSAAPRSLIVKLGPQPAMRISGQMAAMMGQNPGKDNSAFDWASRCSGAHVVGWESVTVPAGTFRALHVTTDDEGEVWASRDVPFGLVKLRGKQGDLVLSARGTDAKSSITEKPLDMGGMMSKP